jgi:hypothetical protein
MSAAGPRVIDRLSEQIDRSPGLTATELAEGLFGPGTAASRIQFALSILYGRDRVCRRGEGSRARPYRYFPKGGELRSGRRMHGEPALSVGDGPGAPG